MNLTALTSRALELRARFDAANLATGRHAWTREEIAQGFVGDIGDLTKLVMAKANLRPADNLDARLAHELADCLWSVLVLADAYAVDMEKAFLTTMDDLERQLSVTVPSNELPSASPIA